MHRKDHAGNGSFDTVVKNIKKMVDRGLTHLIEARMTVTPESAKYMFESVKMLLDLGINNICPIAASDLDWSDEALKDYEDNYNKMLELYVDILNDTDNNRNINIKHIDDIIGTAMEPEVSDTKMCHIGNKYWVCIDWNKQAKFEMEECKDCVAKIICKSGCPFQNLTENHDFYTPTKSYCKIQKILVPAALKFRDKLLTAENIRSRKLNVLIENLKLKKYFDTEVKTADITSLDFKMKLDRFLEMYNNLDCKGNVIPSFNDYFTFQLSMSSAILDSIVDK